MRVITVPVADRPECATALASALQLAKKLGANVMGCHVRPHRNSTVSLPAELKTKVFGPKTAIEVPVQSESIETDSDAAHRLLDRVAQEFGLRVVKKLNGSAEPVVMWHERVGSPDKILSIIGPTSDMLVVSRPNGDDSKLAQIFLLEALLRSSRPVMILPPDVVPTIGDHVMVAWNQSNEAMRAVVAALPVLQKAKAVTIAVAGEEKSLGPKSSQLARYLEYWGIDAKILRTRCGSPDKKLLQAYRESGSDLLVMGAYSRSRLRQRIFGGVTDFMLRSADIPVLMLHS